MVWGETALASYIQTHIFLRSSPEYLQESNVFSFIIAAYRMLSLCSDELRTLPMIMYHTRSLFLCLRIRSHVIAASLSYRSHRLLQSQNIITMRRFIGQEEGSASSVPVAPGTFDRFSQRPPYTS